MRNTEVLKLKSAADALQKPSDQLTESDSTLKTINRRCETLLERNPYVTHYGLEKHASTLLQRVQLSIKDEMVGLKLKESLAEAKAQRDAVWKVQKELIEEVKNATAALETEIKRCAPKALELLERRFENLLADATKALRPFAATDMEAEEKAKAMSVPAMALVEYQRLRERLVSGSVTSQAYTLIELLS